MDLPRRLRACAVTTVTAASPSWRGAALTSNGGINIRASGMEVGRRVRYVDRGGRGRGGTMGRRKRYPTLSPSPRLLPPRRRLPCGRSLIGYAVFPSMTLDMASVGTILVSWNPAA